MTKRLLTRLLFLAMVLTGTSVWAQTFYDMSTGNYSQDFANISGWTNNYAAGTGASNWRVATSVATSTVDHFTVFQTNASSGGIQKGSQNMVFLGTSSNSSAATDLLLNFTGRTAGTISFDWAKVLNSPASTRTSDIKVQYSINNGSTFTDITGYTIPRVTNSSTAESGSITTVALPAAISNQSQVVFRFYLWSNGNTSGSGNRPKISIDNIAVTSTAMGPSVTTDAASSITANSAIFNGKVKANNTTIATSFEYGLTTSYGTVVTATTPNSISGNTETAYTASVSGLSPNTTYNYRAVGNNGTVYNGSNQSFVTLANVPAAPVVNDATLTSLNVTLDAVTQNSNPAATQYAIQEAGGQYVQANGSLGASAVWQTSATWATRTVTGLANNTTYTFRVKARNSANTETAFGTNAQGTTLANTSPILQADALTAFGSVCVNTTSATRSFVLNGDNLTSADVVVGPLAGYTFSATTNGTYTSTLTITPVNGDIIADVFVRLTPTAAGSYSGNIPVTGGGAPSINVAASGTGINTPATATTASVTVFTATTATMGGNVTAEGCSTVTEKGVVYATTATPAIGGTGVSKLAASTTGTGAFTVSAEGLAPLTQYYVRSYAINNGGTVYGSQVTFTTPCNTPVNVTGVASVAATAQVTLSWTNSSCFDEVLVVARANSDVNVTPSGNGSAYTAAASFSAGTALATGQYAVYKGTGTSVIVTGLTNDTPYHFTIFTRKGTLWSSGTLKTETPVISYCAAASANADEEFISGVNFNGTSYTSLASTYSNFTSIVFNAEQYLSYTITITVGTGYSSDQGLVWIDWNRDGDFDDANEAIALTVSTGAGPYTGTITVPGNAVVGNTRMRVRLHDTTFTANATACGNSGYGEVEDYTINIMAGTPPLAAPVATAATDINPTGFTANWDAVTGASSYRLDVYEQSSTAGNASEDFTNGTTAPTGWSYTGVGTYTGATNVSSMPTSLALNDTNDRIETATFGEASSISFWIKGQGISSTSSLLIEGYNGSAWITVDNLSGISNSGTTKTYNSSSTPALPANLVKFRFTYTKVSGNLSFDDFSVAYNNVVTTYASGYNNRTVSGVSENVTGLQNATLYHYRVRATSPLSPNSNVINVTTGRVNTWNGTAWSGGSAPTVIDDAVISGDFKTNLDGVFTAHDLTVATDSLIVAPMTSLTVKRKITVDNGAAMLIKSNGSVIQIDETAENSGQVNVERYSPSLKRLDYKLWSSPVTGITMAGFSPLTETNRFYRYNPQNNNYSQIATSTGFNVGQGYLIRMPNNHPSTATAWLGKFKGGLTTGAKQVAVDAGYNAVGNPYASPIDADDFIAANSANIDGTLYFWRKTNAAAAEAYVTYNSVMGGNNNGAEADAPNGIIAVGQGFIVNATSGNVVFNNAMRVSNFGNQSYSTPERHRIWVNLTNNSGAYSQALVGYAAGATNGVDTAADSKYFGSGNSALYSVLGNGKYAIQGRALPFVSSDVIPMGYKAVEAGNFTIAIDHVDGLFTEGQVVYLRDNVSNTVHNLSDNSYNFTTEAGTFEGRFEIIFQNIALGTDLPVLKAENVIVYKDGNSIKINAGSIELSDVTVYDMRGREIVSQKGINASEAVITNITTEQQVLIVKINSVKNGSVSRRLIF